MIVADDVVLTAKDRGAGLLEARAHIMDRGDRLAKEGLESGQERNDLVGVFTGQLDSAENNLCQAVPSGHQDRAIAVAGTIQVQDIPPLDLQGRGDACGALLMGEGQIDHELPGQNPDLTGTDRDVSGPQFGTDLFGIVMVPKEPPADMDHDIVSIIARGRNQSGKRGTVYDVPARGTFHNRFAGQKGADVQGRNASGRGLEHLQPRRRGAALTLVLGRAKIHQGPLGEKVRGSDTLADLIQVFAERFDQGEAGVLFIVTPSWARRFSIL